MQKPEKKCSGRLEENLGGMLFEQLKEGREFLGADRQEYQILQRRIKAEKMPLVFL